MEGACLVLDVGSGLVKGGFGGGEVPQVFRNICGTAKYHSALPQSDGDTFLCNDAEKRRGLLKLSYPVENGHVRDWSAQQSILVHVSNQLGVSTKDHPLLLTEAAFASRPQRSKWAQLVFEEQQHPALLFANQGLLSLYASGNTSGIVLDVGDGITQTCPVFDGYTIREAVRRVDFGGRDVTDYLKTLLRQYGTFFDTSAETDIVRQIKEQRCYVATKGGDLVAKIRHKLPDGTEINLGGEVSQAPEAFFQPSLVGREHGGVVNIVSESIKMTDIDLRREIYQNVLLSGGSTLLSGFCPRFLTEMTKLTPRDCKIRILAPSERLFTSWIGGSFLSQLSTFRQLCVKRSDYQEEGENILHSKVFC